MSDVWRIFVVEGDEALNRSIVNSLRKDGYIVQGVMNGADAVHILWSEEYDVVLCDLRAPGADGFELLQWLRASRPNTRMILVGSSESSALRMQALESGAAGYLEKPLDLHLLKEELRRLLQQTGFSANLDSFDLLDVIQIITMNRNNIALLVNTGLEERGLLCFQGGELVWAEYGVLRGEEAFFALAAHKNGTVTQQPWNEQVIANVTQPLSRLIFQALQYRTKYASQQPYSGEMAPVSGQLRFDEAPRSASGNNLLMLGEEDDTPFGVLADDDGNIAPTAPQAVPQSDLVASREWWERTGALSSLNSEDGISAAHVSLSASVEAVPAVRMDASLSGNEVIVPTTIYKMGVSPRDDLPSWLTDQPTSADLPVIRASALSGSVQMPVVRPSSPEWQPPPPLHRNGQSTAMSPVTGPPVQPTGAQQRVSGTGMQMSPVTGPPVQPAGMQMSPTMSPVQPTGTQQRVSGTGMQMSPVTGSPVQPTGTQQMSSPQNRLALDTGVRKSSKAEWQMPEPTASRPLLLPEGDVQYSTPIGSGVALSPIKEETGAHQAIKRNYNYSALVSALQTLGYSISGFIAAAVVNLDGQPIAQVAVDDLDISRICKHFSNVLKATMQLLDQGMWGDYEDTVITSSDRYILMRVVGREKVTFQVLITTHDAKPADSLEVMTNVEGAISAALNL